MTTSNTDSERNWAYYIRVSTNKQDSGQDSQLSSVTNWLEANGVTPAEADEYVDYDKSGSDDDREQFNDLLTAVEDGEYTDVVLPELSRLARKTATSAAFIDSAVENDVSIHLMDDMIDSIRPDDPMSQFFAKMLSLWMEEERKQMIRRIQRGVNHAQQEGKWTGRTPTGFTTNEDGYLVVKPEEYEAVVNALERVDGGESLRSVERDTRFTRQTLSKLYKNNRERYLEPDDLDPDSAEGEERKARRIEEALNQYSQTYK